LAVKDATKATIRCILPETGQKGKDFHSGKDADKVVIYAKAY